MLSAILLLLTSCGFEGVRADTRMQRLADNVTAHREATPAFITTNYEFKALKDLQYTNNEENRRFLKQEQQIKEQLKIMHFNNPSHEKFKMLNTYTNKATTTNTFTNKPEEVAKYELTKTVHYNEGMAYFDYSEVVTGLENTSEQAKYKYLLPSEAVVAGYDKNIRLVDPKVLSYMGFSVSEAQINDILTAYGAIMSRHYPMFSTTTTKIALSRAGISALTGIDFISDEYNNGLFELTIKHNYYFITELALDILLNYRMNSGTFSYYKYEVSSKFTFSDFRILWIRLPKDTGYQDGIGDSFSE